MLCLFCNGEEKNYKSDVDFICSSCVILLAGAEQDELKKAYAKAIEKGFKDKAYAIESFLMQEEYSVRKTKKSQRDMERERPVRKVRPSRHQVRT